MSMIRKMRRNLVPRKVATALTLKRIVDANGGDYQAVKADFGAAIMKAFPQQFEKEVFAPAGAVVP